MILQYNLGNLQKVNNYREAFQLVGMPSQIISFTLGRRKNNHNPPFSKNILGRGNSGSRDNDNAYEDMKMFHICCWRNRVEKLIELLDVYGKCCRKCNRQEDSRLEHQNFVQHQNHFLKKYVRKWSEEVVLFL